MTRRETFRVQHSPFRVSGPEVEMEVEVWSCCRDWDIIVASLTWDESKDGWSRDYYQVRKCGYCREFPRPKEFLQ